MKTKTIKIHGIVLHLLGKDEILDLIERSIFEREQKIIVCTDFRLLSYARNSNYSFSSRFIYYPDSTGIFLALKFLFRKRMKEFRKLVSTDLHLEILKIANKNRSGMFLLGDTDKTLASFCKLTNKEYPDIKITGAQNGYFEIEKNIVEKINLANPNILLVGMGVPKQEKWVNENYLSLNVALIVTVGAFFSIYSRKISRAPKFMRTLSLEWLYRLFREPGRLWKRYLIEFPVFLLNFIRERDSA